MSIGITLSFCKEVKKQNPCEGKGYGRYAIVTDDNGARQFVEYTNLMKLDLLDNILVAKEVMSTFPNHVWTGMLPDLTYLPDYCPN